MPLPFLFRALRRLGSISSQPRPRRAASRQDKRYQLTLEGLEDRTVPSVIWYANAAATGGNTGQNWTNAYTDLQKGLQSAQPGDQIWVAQGTYKPTSTTDRTISFALDNGVALYGGFGGAETQLAQRDPIRHVSTLSGDIGVPAVNSDNSYNVVTATNLTAPTALDGFTITAGNANGGTAAQQEGGGLYTTAASTLLVTNVGFTGNAASLAGGGMFSSASSPTVTNVTFSNNTASSASAGFGGGMYNTSSSAPTLFNVVFSSNYADADGGGMFNNNNSSPTMASVTFDSNAAGRTGGGMANRNSSPTMSNLVFSSNSARIHAGGMYNEFSSPMLSNVVFSSNSAGYDGGGMYTFALSPTLVNVTFTNNAALRDGGGMYSTNLGSPTLTHVTFSGNTASSKGGGMYNFVNSSPALTDVFFTGNSAAQGGGMANQSDRPTLTSVTFNGNSASSTGGGMYNVEGSPIMTQVVFEHNTAYYGGGIYNAPLNTLRSSPVLSNVTFNANSAASSGGGIYDDALSTPTLTNVTFTGNSAGAGGGMYDVGSSSSTLVNVLFAANYATFGGAMVNGSNTSATLTNVTFSRNSATSAGGAMLNTSSSSVSLTSCILWDDFGGEITGSATVSYSDVQGGWSGPNNISSDPRFVDPSHDDFHLLRGSPAIDSGTNAAAPRFDLDGKPRPIDGSGLGTPITDMGAYEYRPPPGTTPGLSSVLIDGTGGDFEVLNRQTGTVQFDVQPFGAFSGGLHIATGDITGDGVADVVVAAGPGGGAEFKVYDGQALLKGQAVVVAEVLAWSGFTGGVTVAVGDLNGDGHADVVVAAGAGGLAEVKVYDGTALARGQAVLLADFFAFPNGFTGGLTVAVGDVTGDGVPDIIVGAGPGGMPEVKVFDGQALLQGRVQLLNDFFAFALSFRGGVNVAAGDLDGSGRAELVVGAGAGGGPQVEVFSTAGMVSGMPQAAWYAYPPSFGGGVRVSVGTIALNGVAYRAIFTGAGPGGSPQEDIFDAVSDQLLDTFFAGPAAFAGGVFPAGSGLG